MIYRKCQHNKLFFRRRRRQCRIFSLRAHEVHVFSLRPLFCFPLRLSLYHLFVSDLFRTCFKNVKIPHILPVRDFLWQSTGYIKFLHVPQIYFLAFYTSTHNGYNLLLKVVLYFIIFCIRLTSMNLSNSATEQTFPFITLPLHPACSDTEGSDKSRTWCLRGWEHQWGK